MSYLKQTLDLTLFTPAYQKHIALMEKAEMQFDNNPCQKTAKILSDLRHTAFTDVEKYTQTHIKKLNADTKIWNYMIHVTSKMKY